LTHIPKKQPCERAFTHFFLEMVQKLLLMLFSHCSLCLICYFK